MNREIPGLAALAGLALVAGCAGPAGEAPTGQATVRDSAGVAIVENTGPTWTNDRMWTVADSPRVDLGGDASDPSRDLDQVTGAVRLADGGIAVANGATSEIRLYDAGGKLRGARGRKGSGPGEFQMLAGLWVSDADSLLAYDALAQRVTVLGADDGVRTFLLGGGAGGVQLPTDGRMSLALPVGPFGDGSILGTVLGFRINDPRKGSHRDTVVYLRYGPDGAVRDTVARLPGIEMEAMTLSVGDQTFTTPSPVPLGRVTVIGVGRGLVYAALNEAYQIEVRTREGRLVRVIRVASEPVTITVADQAAHRKETLDELGNQPGMAMVPEALKAQMRARVEQAQYPKTFPFLAELQVDQAGYLWAQETTPPDIKARRYAVFDSTGTLLGRVTMPERFRPTFIGTEEVLGIWTDEDGVVHVRSYEIRGRGRAR